MADASVAAPAARPSPARRAGRGAALRELPVLLLVAVGLSLLLKTFVVQAFFIPSGSMETTLHGCPGCTGDRVLVDKVVHDVVEVRRGEIVVFDGTGSFGASAEAPVPPQGALAGARRGVAQALGLAVPGRTDYVKRAIGLPGDRVACCDEGRVTVQPAGQARPVPLREPYVTVDDQQRFCAAGSGAQACPPGAPGVLVPPGRLWVMGDARGASLDSRGHRDAPGDGTVPVERVVGRVRAIVWPLDRARLLPVPDLLPAR